MNTPLNAQYERVLIAASEDFPEADPVRRAFTNILFHISNKPKGTIRHLTFGMLREAAQLGVGDGEILHRAIAYLTGKRANILELKYEFSLDSFEHELNEQEEEIFVTEEIFYDPRTGMPVKNCADYIYIFFRPNSKAFH